MDALSQDARLAVRQFFKRPAATALIVIILALGIGVNTAAFTMVNAAILQKVAAVDPDALVRLFTSTREQRGRNLSYPEFLEFRDRVTAFAGLVASEIVTVSVGGDMPERARATLVSGNYFDVLGVGAARGRTFVPDEDRTRGTHPVVVLSYGFWQRRYGGAPSAIGTTITINGHRFTIVGVAPQGFEGIEFARAGQMWIPLAMLRETWPARPTLLTAHRTWLHVFGRLAPGVTPEEASAMASTVARTLGVPASSPDGLTGAEVQRVVGGGLTADQRARQTPAYAMLMAVPALVLLIVCANIANLVLARSLLRRKELVVRHALGATRARLVRQLLTESVMLALVGGGLGVVASFWFIGALAATVGLPLGVVDLLAPDARVLTFTAALAVATGLLFGIAPALGSTKTSLAPALKEDASAYGIRRHGRRMRDGFVIIEVAVSAVLLITGGLLLRSLANVLDVDPGFDPRHGVAVSFDLTMQGYTAEERARFYQQILERARAIPGIRSVSLGGMPLTAQRTGSRFEADTGAAVDSVMFTGVWPDYFRTMGIPLRRGREFSDADDLSGAPVIIVNETLARALWGDQDPIGRHVRLAGATQPLREVVGVARDGKYVRLSEFSANTRKTAYEFAFLPERQSPEAGSVGMSLIVRTAGAPASIGGALGQVIRDSSPNPPLARVSTLDEIVAGGALQLRRLSVQVAVLGLLALALVALGLYGVIAQAVSGRTREIGIRMSLGARRATVLTLFLQEAVRLSAIGVMIGAGLSVAFARVLSRQADMALIGFPFGVTLADPLTYSTAAAVLFCVAAAASYFPARRAARVDPVVALRCE